MIHTLDASVGFLEHISKDLGLEKTNTGLPFGTSFISSNLNVNRIPKVNTCLEGCGLKILGYKRCACPKCSMRVVIENTDNELSNLNIALRSKSKSERQPTVITFITQEQFIEMMVISAEPDFKKISYNRCVWWRNVFEKKTTMKM